MSNWDAGEWAFAGLLGVLAVLLLALVVGVVCGGVDFLQERRAFDAITTCEAKQQRAVRKTLSAHVVCLPDRTRRDTTTVEVKQ